MTYTYVLQKHYTCSSALVIALLAIVCLALPRSADAGTFSVPSDFLALNTGLVGYWTFDGKDMANGKALDRSGSGFNASPISIATSTFYAPGKVGQALNFDGVNDYVDRGTGPSSVNSVSFWVYPKTTTEYFVNLTSTTDFVWVNAGTVTATGLVSPTIYVNGAVTSTLSANKWSHVVVTTATAENASNLDIGRTSDADYMEGILDDVRLYSRALSAEEVLQLYNMGANTRVNASQVGGGNLSQGLVGYWTFDGKDMANGKALDRSGSGFNASPISIATSTFYAPGKVGQALNFDGVNDRLTLSSSPITDFTLPFTICAWSNHVTVGRIANFYSSASNGMNFGVSAGKIIFALITNGTDVGNQNSTITLAALRWYHLCGTFDGTEVGFYINAVTDSLGGAVTFGNQSGNTIGARGTFGGGFFGGRIDDVRVYSRLLSAEEIKQIYLMGR